MNHSHITQLEAPAPSPSVDYCDIESALLKKFPSWGSSESTSISQIPFQMFSYRVAERGKIGTSSKENSESESDRSACGDDLTTSGDEAFLSSEKKTNPANDSTSIKKHSLIKKSLDFNKPIKQQVTPRSARPPQMSSYARPKMVNSDLPITSNPRTRRTTSGHVSDSELS
ncbi:hypothetical protein PIB30_074885 [Stylosanthes scabra]|uniref:Uncharacterized protein n=1 Tax=Stylosanthes scabra TaxID=79078 RepID=A0ABU6VT60_9FABA|nr:hypothetical protein [Stylosanthes scabra]